MTTSLHTPELGAAGETCRACSAPLAVDQRYCLHCGQRRAEARVPFSLLAPEPERPAAPPPPPPRSRIPGPALAITGGGLAAMLVALGILIGSVSSDRETQVVQASVPEQKPPVVNITNTGGGGTAETAETLTSDWPAGEEGWTVQLETFANDGSVPVSDVEAAKSDAESKGAEDVGALNSDEFTSLDPGLYVVYSGVFTGDGGRAKAQAALKTLRKDFPDAKVVQVSSEPADTGARSAKTVGDDELQDLAGATGEEQQKKSAKLPDELNLGGAPPPKDQKAPGGGEGGGVDIE
jgi:hypothetical protein